MMVGALEGRFLEMLVFALQPRLVLEIGMFTGYSSLSMAAALPPGGRIVTCDVNPKAEEVARRHIGASPYADRIEIRMGPALDTITGLDGPFDLVFIDADKTNYRNYYDAVLPKLAERGMIAVDNVLWSGQVIEPKDTSENTEALRAFNDYVNADARTVNVVCTVRDGVTLVRRA
jgi:caffeoyl-CoA O-methyltransferase